MGNGAIPISGRNLSGRLIAYAIFWRINRFREIPLLLASRNGNRFHGKKFIGQSLRFAGASCRHPPGHRSGTQHTFHHGTASTRRVRGKVSAPPWSRRAPSARSG